MICALHPFFVKALMLINPMYYLYSEQLSPCVRHFASEESTGIVAAFLNRRSIQMLRPLGPRQSIASECVESRHPSSLLFLRSWMPRRVHLSTVRGQWSTTRSAAFRASCYWMHLQDTFDTAVKS